jgi:hypothetical protein
MYCHKLKLQLKLSLALLLLFLTTHHHHHHHASVNAGYEGGSKAQGRRLQVDWDEGHT